MKVRIQKTSDGLYSAESFNPPSHQPVWTTSAAMNAYDLSRELLELGFHPTDISDAFEEADPDLIPKQREHVPTVGEEVLVLNHLGSFVVEEVDVEAKTANLRFLRSGVLMKDVEWRTIWPFDDEARDLFKEIAKGGPVKNELLHKFLELNQKFLYGSK